MICIFVFLCISFIELKPKITPTFQEGKSKADKLLAYIENYLEFIAITLCCICTEISFKNQWNKREKPREKGFLICLNLVSYGGSIRSQDIKDILVDK